ncbi:hypothetical protein AGLY_017048 [Aphis glycines]|uniref:Uncharacterized protein n=1 Tax=Aphis glycines TaxID=307491 RepID=A0A6G0SWT4_APHGL|nr:hypothetical protein AGLY_017048 [Aphis glycines]
MIFLKLYSFNTYHNIFIYLEQNIITNTYILQKYQKYHTVLMLGIDISSLTSSMLGLKDFSLNFLSTIDFNFFFGDKRIGVILFLPPTMLTFCASLVMSITSDFVFSSVLNRLSHILIHFITWPNLLITMKSNFKLTFCKKEGKNKNYKEVFNFGISFSKFVGYSTPYFSKFSLLTHLNKNNIKIFFNN